MPDDRPSIPDRPLPASPQPAPEKRTPRIRFDDVDIAILEQLQQNSKITNAALAKSVGISPPSTLERVKKLEQSGVIDRYAAILNPHAVGKAIAAFVSITLREHGKDRLNDFAHAVSQLAEVRAVHHTAGDEDFFLNVLVTDMHQYEDFVVRKLSAIPNIGRIKTSFCLSTIKHDTAVPLDAVDNANPDA